jgi:long-chain acyl-CoA synthetase
VTLTDTTNHAPAVRAARAAAWLAKQVEIALARVELTGPQYRVLMLLGSGTASATDAAERLAVSPPSVTAVIDGLVARQLVERGHGTDDRRRVVLSLTAAGTAALADADGAVAERLEELADHGDTTTTPAVALDHLAWWLDAIKAAGTAGRAEPR